MLQAKIQDKFIENTPELFFETIKKTVKKNKSENMTIDISMINPIDAAKIVIVASTYNFLKFDNSQINWIVNSKEVEKIAKPLNIGNSKFVYLN